MPPDEQDAFGRWVTHIRDGTRADDNLTRAVELTRLVAAANSAAASGATVRLPGRCSVNPIKVGVIGGGGIVDAHIRGYRAYADAIKVTAVADVVTETAQRRAAELDAAAYTDFRQMITEADLDAVDICLPHHLHADAIVAAAEAGKHILCEKPLCLTVEQAAEVQRAVSAAGVTLMCAHNQLYLPAVAKAKQLLDARRTRHGLRGSDHRQLLQRLRPAEHGLARERLPPVVAAS